jgi:hypothetical protein
MTPEDVERQRLFELEKPRARQREDFIAIVRRAEALESELPFRDFAHHPRWQALLREARLVEQLV